MSTIAASRARLRRLAFEHARAHARQMQQNAPDWMQADALNWVFMPASAERADDGEIIIGVSDALPGHAFPTHLPSMVGGEHVPVKVVRARRPQSQAGAASCELQNITCLSGVGSLGALVTDRASHSRYFAVTAAHVAAGDAEARYNDDIEIRVGQTVTGHLARWLPVMGSQGRRARIDAALVEIGRDDANALLASGLHWPASCSGVTRVGDAWTLMRTQGPLAGVFKGAYFGWIAADQLTGNGNYWLDGGRAYEQSPPYSRGGDSGAPIWNAQGELVAFHCAALPDHASGWNAIASMARWVLDDFDVELLSQSAGAAQAVRRPSVALPDAVPVVPSPRVPPSTTPLSAAGVQAQEVDILAQTLWGEARGERPLDEALSAVACVVLNRVKRQTYWGTSIADVCLKPWQFSCWNLQDPNLPKLKQVDHRDPLFVAATRVAEKACAGQLTDKTCGATHYHARSLVPPPKWARGLTPCCVIGRHLFFNNVA